MGVEFMISFTEGFSQATIATPPQQVVAERIQKPKLSTHGPPMLLSETDEQQHCDDASLSKA